MFLYKLKDLPCYTEYRKKEINKKEKRKGENENEEVLRRV
jgi:hypothetical protein